MKTSFSLFVENLRIALQKPLPGISAHALLEPSTRKKFPTNPDLNLAVPSAVLALFFPADGGIGLIFIQRPQYNGVHSGQIAFPGGRYESSDKDILFTALRETHEEIGIDPSLIVPIGRLSELYIPPSNFVVSPFVAYLSSKPAYNHNAEEVAEVFSVDIAQLLDNNATQVRRIRGRNFDFDAPCFFVDNHLIWGATAMMLNELLLVIKTFYSSQFSK